MRVILVPVVALLAGLPVAVQASPPAAPAVKLGIDVLIDQGFKPLAGRRVGLITNPTGVTGDLRSTIDVLHAAPNVELVALFGPEHGVRGDAHAGDPVGDTRDARTGLAVYSLYGRNRKPSPDILADLDVLVFDIQDIGSRSYTYISTMAVAMEAAAEHGVRFVVLDRPNPLGGVRIEGRPLDLKYRSFVGYLPIPYVHGLTVGELARMINGRGWLDAAVASDKKVEGDGVAGALRCDLTVVPLTGWKRAMGWADTGLHWVPTSPHIPRAESALHYAATGIMGELRVIDEGVGYTLPFELAGAPWIDPILLADALNARGLTGVNFRPIYYRPYYSTFAGRTCGGVQIVLTDPKQVRLTPIQFHVMDVVRSKYTDRPLFGKKRDGMFDKVCGSDRVRRMFLDGRPIGEILAFWNEGVEAFRTARAEYLLYD
ncbi:MAG: DUF1343 domain-containing protein [Planctomycetes bacterium]|nr:DUF1343 domain-containing protein [Planctomycetota bacterium]